MQTMPETFLIIMPAYNEEVYIEETINSWSRLLNDFSGSEILVINDGSTDGTKDKLDGLSQKLSHLSVIHKENAGHGKTVVMGYQRAADSSHAWVFQTDSDGHFDPKDFYKLWEKRTVSDFILGHRLRRKDSLDRLIITKLAQLWILILFRKYIKDPNIPFRLMQKDYLKKILKKVPEGVFAPNIFLSILASKDGHNLHHIPVSHQPRKKDGKHHKLKLLRGALQGFVELTLFRLNLS